MRAATQSIISLLLLHSSTAMTIPPAKPSLNKPGLKIAAGAALGNILQGFNTGVIMLFFLAKCYTGSGSLSLSCTPPSNVLPVGSSVLLPTASERATLILASWKRLSARFARTSCLPAL